ncbi:hypothetical protein Pcinc_019255 [Petrolisthes cinctipes]|uniref:Uncharacterized protein n=1 Tax=Petrolisthes cinctipes TaxID=88211 RepID=A0AAE1FLT0_PETCI|nr:hypothetical protein Pcinc_019255 [Petrolisthes cinctipes]
MMIIFGLLLLAWPALSCWPAYVQEAVDHSDLVLTAKVLHLGSRRGHGINRMYDLVRLEVKSFMKGEDVFRNHLRDRSHHSRDRNHHLRDRSHYLRDRNHHLKDRSHHLRDTNLEGDEEATFLEDPDTSSSSPLHLSTPNTFWVDGVSASGTCSGRVRVRDVQLFFLKVKTRAEVRRGHHHQEAPVFKVASQPVKVTLEMLRMTEAAATTATKQVHQSLRLPWGLLFKINKCLGYYTNFTLYPNPPATHPSIPDPTTTTTTPPLRPPPFPDPSPPRPQPSLLFDPSFHDPSPTTTTPPLRPPLPRPLPDSNTPPLRPPLPRPLPDHHHHPSSSSPPSLTPPRPPQPFPLRAPPSPTPPLPDHHHPSSSTPPPPSPTTTITTTTTTTMELLIFFSGVSLDSIPE